MKISSPVQKPMASHSKMPNSVPSTSSKLKPPREQSKMDYDTSRDEFLSTLTEHTNESLDIKARAVELGIGVGGLGYLATLLAFSSVSPSAIGMGISTGMLCGVGAGIMAGKLGNALANNERLKATELEASQAKHNEFRDRYYDALIAELNDPAVRDSQKRDWESLSRGPRYPETESSLLNARNTHRFLENLTNLADDRLRTDWRGTLSRLETHAGVYAGAEKFLEKQAQPDALVALFERDIANGHSKESAWSNLKERASLMKRNSTGSAPQPTTLATPGPTPTEVTPKVPARGRKTTLMLSGLYAAVVGTTTALAWQASGSLFSTALATTVVGSLMGVTGPLDGLSAALKPKEAT